ncbi:hypothetical protein OPV22_010661 [Ensete ventricosum]|uniref:Uncharacterized protein n=1 Tax=Ensete ventricosum TaxID=4639 RepID=A0AAV8PWA3_ENSVE|nr:hypothetical protein OPV22_010661 [Ensete ventricosum]
MHAWMRSFRVVGFACAIFELLFFTALACDSDLWTPQFAVDLWDGSTRHSVLMRPYAPVVSKFMRLLNDMYGMYVFVESTELFSKGQHKTWGTLGLTQKHAKRITSIFFQATIPVEVT